MRYLWRLTRGRTGRYLGHNPAGAAMTVTLLLFTAVSCVSGWMQITQRYFGVSWVEQLHTWSSYAALIMGIVHVLGARPPFPSPSGIALRQIAPRHSGP